MEVLPCSQTLRSGTLLTYMKASVCLRTSCFCKGNGLCWCVWSYDLRSHFILRIYWSCLCLFKNTMRISACCLLGHPWKRGLDISRTYPNVDILNNSNEISTAFVSVPLQYRHLSHLKAQIILHDETHRYLVSVLFSDVITYSIYATKHSHTAKFRNIDEL